jgi:hypothetical protein
MSECKAKSWHEIKHRRAASEKDKEKGQLAQKRCAKML